LNRNLTELFSTLENNSRACSTDTEDFFVFSGEKPSSIKYDQIDIDFLIHYFSGSFDSSLLEGSALRLFELSFNAFDLFLHAWLSELPVEEETVRYGKKILAAAEGAAVYERKNLAEKAAADRGDSDTLAVLDAAYKVQREIDRMMGLLRFSPQDDVYAARCAPDHFVLPALARYFSARFGEVSWSITDEKRGLCLSRVPPQPAKLVPETDNAQGEGGDEWEELWRHYHSTINNEERKNPALQRQFMPRRYWKYLPEM
jgi:probable DNA metabolism protein